MTLPSELATRWRTRGDELAPYASAATAAFHTAASELEEALRSAEDALRSPAEAEAESGYSRRRLRELSAEGKLKNYGRKGSPRYRCGDLPTRSKGRGDTSGGFDAESHVAGIIGGTS